MPSVRVVYRSTKKAICITIGPSFFRMIPGLIISLWPQRLPAPNNPPQIDTSTNEKRVPETTVFYANVHHEPMSKELADGTKVNLYYGSHIVVKFDDTTRDVVLEGQATFKVPKNSMRPFIVHAGKTTIRVLGTFFNVTHYRNEPACRVTLINGSVQISNGSRKRTIKPSEQAIVNGSSLKVIKLAFPDQIYQSWTDPNPYFYFYHTRLDEALRQLARWYDVRIWNPQNLTGASIDGKVLRYDSLKTTLDQLQKLEGDGIHLEYTRNSIHVSRQ